MKTMTRKQWVEIHHPEMLSTICWGGVSGCPGIFKELGADEEVSTCSGGSVEKCELCWNRLIAVEEIKPVKKVKKGFWKRFFEVFR